MATTTKKMSRKDQEQTLRSAYNDVNSTLAVDGFLVGLVGRKVVQTITTTTLANDTAVFAFSENGVALYTITVIYTDGTQTIMLSAERTA